MHNAFLLTLVCVCIGVPSVLLCVCIGVYIGALCTHIFIYIGIKNHKREDPEEWRPSKDQVRPGPEGQRSIGVCVYMCV